MSNYTKTTNFAAKDSLPSGNAAKIVKGTEIDTEFNNIATASATKANKNNAALTGTTTFETISDGTIAITAFVDEDNMVSNSATLLPTQQSVKAYVDSQVTAQDLDFQADTGGALSIDLDSESLTFTGGTGIDTSGLGNAVTFAIDSTVATLTGTQTLSNKTLATPVVSGNLTTDGLIDGRDVATDGTKLDGIESGATADQTAAEIKTAYESNANTNAFTDADESKLDGIEALADVTDTANVTAAGALMDSELTNITAVKALNQGVATTDSPSFAGVTAPITGNVTGNLTGNVTGNVTGDVTGNVTGNLTGTILTGSQPNITSVGGLNSLSVSGATTLEGNFTAAGQTGIALFANISNKRVGVQTSSPSVSLDVGSATDAILVPVGTTAQRPTGAAGQFRYNSTTGEFEGYTDSWGAIAGGGGGTASILQDADGDTKVQVEESANEDKIRFDTAGTERAVIDSSGLDVTGTVTADGLTVDGATSILKSGSSSSALIIKDAGDSQATIQFGSTNNYKMQGGADYLGFNLLANGTTVAKFASGGDISFYEDTGTTPKFFWDASAESLGIGTSSPLAPLDVKSATGNVGFNYGTSLSPERANLWYDTDGSGWKFNIGKVQSGAFTSQVTIQDNGNVGIGTSSPSYTLSVNSGSSTVPASLESTGAESWLMLKDTNTTLGNVRLGSASNNMIAFAGGSERMRIVAGDGNVLIGTTTIGYAFQRGLAFNPYNESYFAVAHANGTASGNSYALFTYNAGIIGSITQSGTTAISFNTSSDQRLKENIVDAPSASDDIDAIQVRSFDWKSDGSHQKYGMVAQELLSVAPLAVSQPEDPEQMMGVDYSKLVPMLVKEIQSLRNRVAQLEG